jgi:uncharacterized protein HemX
MKIDGEALNVALAQAVLTAFTPEMQSEVFRESLRQYLFEPVKDRGYSDKPSPFTQAFQKALDTAAFHVAKDFISQPAQMERLRTALAEAFDLTLGGTEFKQKIIDKVARAMSGW